MTFTRGHQPQKTNRRASAIACTPAARVARLAARDAGVSTSLAAFAHLATRPRAGSGVSSSLRFTNTLALVVFIQPDVATWLDAGVHVRQLLLVHARRLLSVTRAIAEISDRAIVLLDLICPLRRALHDCSVPIARAVRFADGDILSTGLAVEDASIGRLFIQVVDGIGVAFGLITAPAEACQDRQRQDACHCFHESTHTVPSNLMEVAA